MARILTTGMLDSMHVDSPPADRLGVSTPGSPSPLPELVQWHFEQSVPAGPVPAQVRITQHGEMWMKPGGRSMPFTATQLISVEHVEFRWQARFPIVGPLALTVVDEYADDSGRLDVRLLGVPLQRRRDGETVAGEALRYLAELAWVPHALAHNGALEWRQLDDHTAEVSTEVAGERLAVEVRFDADGDIAGTASDTRRRLVDGNWVQTPWGGSFGEYARLGGIRIPTSGEAYWDLPDGRYRYWRGTVSAVELLHEPDVT
jgi:hypothetical protein